MARRMVVGVALAALVLAGLVVWNLDTTPAAADAPTHALLVLPDGRLAAEELASGEREHLAAAPHAGADVIDLAVAAHGTIDDFTAIAYDDGSGPLGFLTYARRGGGPVTVTFTPTDQFPGRLSNRGYRTISPDGRWLASNTSIDGRGVATVLVPLTEARGRPLTEQAMLLDAAVGPVDWNGAVAQPGDISRLTGPVADGYAQLVLERDEVAFAVREVVGLAVESIEEQQHRLAFSAQQPGAATDPRFELRLDRGDAVPGEPLSPDAAILSYHATGATETTFELGRGAGNPTLRAQGHHALVVVDQVVEPDVPEPRHGRAFLVRVADGPGGGGFAEPVRLRGGPVGGALLGGADGTG